MVHYNNIEWSGMRCQKYYANLKHIAQIKEEGNMTLARASQYFLVSHETRQFKHIIIDITHTKFVPYRKVSSRGAYGHNPF